MKSLGRRQTRAMLEWNNRWVKENPRRLNRHERRANATRERLEGAEVGVRVPSRQTQGGGTSEAGASSGRGEVPCL
jgi:hypothetical protein